MYNIVRTNDGSIRKYYITYMCNTGVGMNMSKKMCFDIECGDYCEKILRPIIDIVVQIEDTERWRMSYQNICRGGNVGKV